MKNPLDTLKELDAAKAKLYREVEANCIPLVDLRNKIVVEMGLDKYNATGKWHMLWDYPNLDSYFGGIYEKFHDMGPTIVSGNDCNSDEAATIPMEMYMNPTEEFIRGYYKPEVLDRTAEKERAKQKEKEKEEALNRIFRGQTS